MTDIVVPKWGPTPLPSARSANSDRSSDRRGWPFASELNASRERSVYD